MPTSAHGVVDTGRLAYTSTWLKLLHYEPSRFVPSGWRSAIHSDDFFLSSQGSTDPQAELEALSRALSANEPIDDEHPRCRFPARTRWLQAQLGHTEDDRPEIACPRFSVWAKQGKVSSISLVFATGYLGNPASYYGHTLLKFNEEAQETGRSDLLDLTVNYGAIIEGADDPVSYIVKGISGGYDGGFSHVDFYYHNHNYGENELRDLWEYRLEPSQAAVDLIVAHTWEILGKRYTYYFFRRNCAFRMAEVLEMVGGLDIIPANRPWTIPQALIQQMNRAEVGGRSLVRSVHYHPSRQSRFYARYQNLTAAEQTMLGDVVLGRQQLHGAEFTDLPVDSRQKLLDAVLDYSMYVAAADNREKPRDAPLYVEALRERFRLPAGAQDMPVQPAAPPHHGRPPGWVQLAWAGNDELGGMALLRIRPAYYDPLDSNSYHVPNSALSMGDVQFSVHRGQVRLHKLDLIAIESAQAGISGLPGDRGEAWKLRVGAEQASAACLDCLTLRVQGDYGLGNRWSPAFFTAVYVGGVVQEETNETGWGFVRASGDAILRWDSNLSARLAVEHRYAPGERQTNHQVGRAELRWALGERADVRLSYESDIAQVVALGLGVYW